MGDQEELERLQENAQAVQALLRYAPRAFVLELSGTPKSGKSTTASVLSHFFKRNNFRVHILQERASLCPIRTKGHLFFNIWTACTMLAELLENVDSDVDVLIKDRGLFDSLLWFQLMRRRGELTPAELDHIVNFLLLDRWRSLVDMVAVMKVPAEEALAREHRPLISPIEGSIMNPPMLAAINEALADAQREYGKMFRSVSVIETTGKDPRSTNTDLARAVLDEMEQFLNPEIMVVPRALIESLTKDGPGSFDASCVQDAIRSVEKTHKFVRRDDAEGTEEYVQIVPCGVVIYQSKVFLFRRKEQDPNSRLYGKSTIWRGSHVTRGISGEPVLGQLKSAIVDRIASDLFLSRRFASDLIGYAWDTTHPESRRHFGLIFRVDIDSPEVAEALHQKEFRKGRGYGMTGEFQPPDDLRGRQHELNLEPWSVMALGHLVKII